MIPLQQLSLYAPLLEKTPPPPTFVGQIIPNRKPAVHSEMNKNIVGDDDVKAFQYFLTGKPVPQVQP